MTTLNTKPSMLSSSCLETWVKFGLGGNDTLVGGDGADVLTGGSGSDLFDYNATTEGGDTITDFQTGAGGDVLDIKDLLVGFGGGSDPNDFVTLSGDTSQGARLFWPR